MRAAEWIIRAAEWMTCAEECVICAFERVRSILLKCVICNVPQKGELTFETRENISNVIFLRCLVVFRLCGTVFQVFGMRLRAKRIIHNICIQERDRRQDNFRASGNKKSEIRLRHPGTRNSFTR